MGQNSLQEPLAMLRDLVDQVITFCVFFIFLARGSYYNEVVLFSIQHLPDVVPLDVDLSNQRALNVND